MFTIDESLLFSQKILDYIFEDNIDDYDKYISLLYKTTDDVWKDNKCKELIIIRIPIDDFGGSGNRANKIKLLKRVSQLVDERWKVSTNFLSSFDLMMGGSWEDHFCGEWIGTHGIESVIVLEGLDTIRSVIGSPDRLLELFDRNPDVKKPEELIPKVIIPTISNSFLDEILKNPHALYDIHWREFEHLVAHILDNLGYEVELTRGSKDGGVDIFARKRLAIGGILTIVQCKSIKKGSKVGIDTVKTLFANVDLYNASNGILATTGYFTKGSLALFDSLQHRLSPADHDHIINWIKNVQFAE